MPSFSRPGPTFPRPTANRGIFLYLALAFCLGLGVIFLATVVTRQGYQVDRLKREVVLAERGNDKLALEISRLRAPERLERLAADRLGMVNPTSDDLEFLPLPAKAPGPVELVGILPAPDEGEGNPAGVEGRGFLAETVKTLARQLARIAPARVETL